MDFKTLKVEQYNPFILIVSMNRPECRNAINREMILDFDRLWNQYIAKIETLRCIILTGSGNAFCAGADLKERKNFSIDTWREQVIFLRKTILAQLNCPIPIISAVNGAAYGGGLELVLASTFNYASNTAVFAQPEVKLGIIPGAFGTQHLTRVCPLNRAKELILTGVSFSATEALEWNIVNKVCEPDLLMQDVLTTALRICENAPIAIREAKNVLDRSVQCTLEMGYQIEFEAYQRLLYTKDREEGIKAFNEKRKPLYTGQ